MKKLKDKIIGSLLGGAIGDALGYPIEFKKGIRPKEYSKYLNDQGIISDDTQMTLFTACGLLWRETRGCLKGITASYSNALYEAYLDWYDTQNGSSSHENKVSWIKNIKNLNSRRAPGNTCLSALASGQKGTIENPINDSKGCGGIMRTAPIGLYVKNPKDAGKIAAEASAITHGHPLGIIPSYVFSVMLYYLVYKNASIPKALKKAMKDYENNFNIYDAKTNEYFINLVNKAIKLSKENIIDTKAISSLGEGWTSEEAFAIAIYSCLKYANNFEDAVICATNHDGDSDSTGSIAGNIIGAYLGFSQIPKYFVDNLELKDVIIELASDLSIPVPINEYNINTDKAWVAKYVYCDKDYKL